MSEELDERFPQVAWRSSAADHDFIRRWTLQHRAPLEALVTLCGIRIPWLRVGPGDSRRCPRCEAIAARKVAAELEQRDRQQEAGAR